MPNTRRRRFSVQTSISNNSNNKIIGSSQTSFIDLSPESDLELKHGIQNLVSGKTGRIKSKISPISSMMNHSLEILAESESELTISNSKQEIKNKVDKNVTASSSNIDLFNMLNATEISPSLEQTKKANISENSKTNKHVPRSSLRDASQVKRERYPKQHRIKVRSPKRHQSLAKDSKTSDINKISTGTNTRGSPLPLNKIENEDVITNDQHPESPTIVNDIKIDSNTDDSIVLPQNSANSEGGAESSNHSLDEMCRICHGGDALVSEFGQMISACACRGTVGRVHVKCLEHWLTESGKSRCELCGTRYATRRVHRYGVPRALVMWLLSQNAKQLMVDSLGIMLMSPLAVLAAWLSGKTLAGLMTKDNEVAPWPLASTFVLACMTLVCYYCWIVSAVTRHALGWWIWYRSQYEVRLQSHENE